MKFKLVIDEGGKQLVLSPENDGERQILESMAPPPNEQKAADVISSWTADRPPYKKLTTLTMVFFQ